MFTFLSCLIISFAGSGSGNNEQCTAEAMQYLSEFEAAAYANGWNSEHTVELSERQKPKYLTLLRYLEKYEKFGNLTCSDLGVIKANYEGLKSWISSVNSLIDSLERVQRINKVIDALEQVDQEPIDRNSFYEDMKDPEYVESIRKYLEENGADVSDSASFYEKYGNAKYDGSTSEQP